MCVEWNTEKNCGRCGRDCLGAKCSGGVCEPLVLGPYVGRGKLTIDASKVYYTFNSSICNVDADCHVISSLPKNAGPMTVPSPLAQNALDPYAMATDSSGTYWTPSTGVAGGADVGEIRACPLNSCGKYGENTIVLASGRRNARFVTVRAGRVYWAEETPIVEDGGAAGYVASIVACPSTGCPTAGPIVVASTVDSITQFAVDDENIYFGGGLNEIRRCAITGCGSNATRMATLDENVAELAVDAQHVYVVTQLAIARCPKASGCGAGPEKLVALPQDYPPAHDLVMDADFLYWAMGGALMRCAKSGCPKPEQINPPEARIGQIAIDEKAIYYVAIAQKALGGGVKKIAK